MAARSAVRHLACANALRATFGTSAAGDFQPIRGGVSGAALTPAAFRTAVAQRRLPSGTAEVDYAFGMMSLATFIDGLAAPGFDEMLKRLGQD